MQPLLRLGGIPMSERPSEEKSKNVEVSVPEHNTMDAQFDVKRLIWFFVFAVLLVAGAVYWESRM